MQLSKLVYQHSERGSGRQIAQKVGGGCVIFGVVSSRFRRMRVLHTADWHLGQHFLTGQERLTEQRLFLDWLLTGYEGNIQGALLTPRELPATSPDVDVERVRQHPGEFTIVDIRNRTEAKQAVFDGALLIPLPELRERAQEVPTDKPVLVHCAGGYRSAAGASILQAALPEGLEIYDLGEAINDFQKQAVH